jgi:hypothetical protein
MATNNSIDAAAADVLGRFRDQEEVERVLLPRLPETLFVEFFLPLFRGDIKDPLLVEEYRSKWFTLARHPQGEVNIIDERGNVLFTTPSYSYTKMFDPTKSDVTGSFKDLITIANQMGTANPIRAKQYLENNLIKKFDAMRVKGHVLTKEEERWIAIFQRYASKNDDNTSSGNSVGGTKPSTLSDDDLEDVDD